MLKINKKIMHKKSKAFTIIELLVVITIIGILTTISVFSFKRVQVSARDTQRSSKTTVITEALESYYSKYGEYPSCSAMSQAADTIATNTLIGIDSNVLTTPSSDNGANSILPACADLIGSTDAFAYIGDTSTTCLTNTGQTSACTQFTLKYREESSGNVISITSRHNMVVVDSYSETNWSTSANHLLKLPTNAVGQSFSSNGGAVVLSKFMLHKWASPTGSIYSKIYNSTGTFGSDSLPTGSPIATSNAVDASTLTTTRQLVSFNFTGANIVNLTSGAKYVVSVEYDNGTDSNYIYVGEDSTSPTHAGNFSWVNNPTWFTHTAFPSDFIFYVYSV